MSLSDSQLTNKVTQLRRSQRACLKLPIIAIRELPGASAASEETNTLIVSAHGALIELTLTVAVGQQLRIKNSKTMEELVCRVINIGGSQSGKREVGVEFEVPSPRFWRIAFPPADWTSRSVDAKAPTAHKPGGLPIKRLQAAPPEVGKNLVNKSGGGS
jgi:hypothetical protein